MSAHTPRTSAQLGLVEFALGYSVEALGHLSEALTGSSDAWIGKNRTQLESAVANVRARIGDIVVTGGPEGAEVFVNSRSVGRLPLAAPVIVAQGSVMVELRAKGNYLKLFPTSFLKNCVDGHEQHTLNLDVHRNHEAWIAHGWKEFAMYQEMELAAAIPNQPDGIRGLLLGSRPESATRLRS